jgi:hypothetical protein
MLGAMRQLALVNASELAAAAAAELAAMEQIKTDVGAGARCGYGVILLKTVSPNLCGVVTERIVRTTSVPSTARREPEVERHVPT